MAASSHELWALSLCTLLAAGCAKGSGEGNAIGQVWAPECGLDGQPFELNPDFFAMQPSGSVEIIDIVVQRGSDLWSFSDGISVFIRDPEVLKESMLSTEISFGGLAAPVEMTLYPAVSGTIRFEELYVPWVRNDTEETVAVFTDVELIDNKDPDERRAILNGDFRFLFERGLPTQYFQY